MEILENVTVYKSSDGFIFLDKAKCLAYDEKDNANSFLDSIKVKNNNGSKKLLILKSCRIFDNSFDVYDIENREMFNKFMECLKITHIDYRDEENEIIVNNDIINSTDEIHDLFIVISEEYFRDNWCYRYSVFSLTELIDEFFDNIKKINDYKTKVYKNKYIGQENN